MALLRFPTVADAKAEHYRAARVVTELVRRARWIDDSWHRDGVIVELGRFNVRSGSSLANAQQMISVQLGHARPRRHERRMDTLCGGRLLHDLALPPQATSPATGSEQSPAPTRRWQSCPRPR